VPKSALFPRKKLDIFDIGSYDVGQFWRSLSVFLPKKKPAKKEVI